MPSARFNLGGASRIAARLGAAKSRAQQVADRATSTLVRRLKPETARVIASDVLNISARKAGAHIGVSRKRVPEGDFVTVGATRTRLPLTDYSPRFSRLDGVTVTTWRDSGPQRLQHAFRRKDKAGVWQRVPYSGAKAGAGRQRGGNTPSGLVARLPIVQRKGPSMHRVFENAGRYAGHVDLRPQLSAFVQSTLAQEIARQIRSGA